MNKKFSRYLKKLALILIIAAIIVACIIFIPMFASLSEAETRDKLASIIDSLGIMGVTFMLVLQVFQIIVAIIPGEPIEVLMGLMYGTVGGLLLSLVGIAVGQAIVFLLVKRFGISFAKKFVNVRKFEELSFIKNAAKRDSLIFILFFIPGTPKDVLTYFVGFTGIPLKRFIILSTLARIPSVVTSTWAGATISEGDFLKTAIIFGITGILGIAGIIINNKITASKKSKSAALKKH